MSNLHPQSDGWVLPPQDFVPKNIYVCFMALIRRQYGPYSILNDPVKTKTLEELTGKINKIIQANQNYRKFERILSIKVSKITSNNNYLDVDTMENWCFDDNILDEEEILGEWCFGYGAVETEVWVPAKD